MLKKCLNSLGEKKQKKKDKVEQIASFPAGSLGPMSCPGTGAPTLEWNRTSASSARRSLPAVITCPNTSKSTAFHEAAGQDALPTDSFDPSDRLTLSGEGGEGGVEEEEGGCGGAAVFLYLCVWRKTEEGGVGRESPNTFKMSLCRTL